MKAEELQLKDFVKVNGRFAHVTGLDTFGNISVVFDDGTFGMYQKEDVEPIPLTKEVLEMNGWENNDCYCYYRIDEHITLSFYMHEHRLMKVFCGIDEWQNHERVTDILFHCEGLKYIHELQHALRLCGLNELADNLKVE